MESKDFYDLMSRTWEDCMKIMKSKGIAYSGLEDKLGNFKRVAKNLSMTPYQVWAVYFGKHMDAIHAWIREEYNDSEPIEERIKDGINYLFLLRALVAEGRVGTFVEYNDKEKSKALPKLL